MIPLWLAAVAHAETDACSPAFVVDTSPSPGAIDVPLDAAIGLVFSPYDCEASSEVAVLLESLSSDGSRVRVLERRVTGASDQVVWITPEGPLAADTELRLTLDGDAEIAFHTGSRTTTPLEGDLAIATFSARYYRASNAVEFDALVGPVANPYGASVVALVNVDDPDLILASGLTAGETIALSAEWVDRRAPDSACVIAVQWDSAGRQIEERETLCREPTVFRGCSTSGGAASAALLALSLLTIRKRRP